MYAVIFKAETQELDQAYFDTAKNMRELALSKYNCIEFISATEGNNEIAISYWKSKEDIKAWKKDKEHTKAQALGKNKWYKSYAVQIVEILREYKNT